MTDDANEAGPPGARLSDYDFDLPDHQIALRPAVPRDSARLLVHAPDAPIRDATVRDLPTFLRPGDRLVVNDSRVIPAQLSGSRIREDGTAGIALTLIEDRGEDRWHAFAKPAKRVRPGDRLSFPAPGGAVEGVVESREGPSVIVAFTGDPLTAGGMPLPPYIAARRAADERDAEDYQTVYAAPARLRRGPNRGPPFHAAAASRRSQKAGSR